MKGWKKKFDSGGEEALTARRRHYKQPLIVNQRCAADGSPPSLSGDCSFCFSSLHSVVIDHLRPSIQALFLVFIHFRSTQHNFHPSYLCRNTHAHTFSVLLFIYCPCLSSLNCLVPPLVTCLAGFQAHPTCGSLNSQNHSQQTTQTNHINIYIYTYIDPKRIYKKKKGPPAQKIREAAQNDYLSKKKKKNA